MTVFDWCLVIGLNGAIIVYGLFRSRETKSSADWFLAGRSLPWWVVGFSLWATAIDSSDLVADSGGTYSLGLQYFVTNWVGTVVGWVLGAHFIILPMYRAGMYTNAEYLEARFGTATRIISVFVQVQYRTLVLGLIATAAFLTLSIVSGWSDSAAWGLVGGIAVLAAIYTAFGGLRSVAVTDTLQFGVMTLAGLIIWFMVWGQVGGLSFDVSDQATLNLGTFASPNLVSLWQHNLVAVRVEAEYGALVNDPDAFVKLTNTKA